MGEEHGIDSFLVSDELFNVRVGLPAGSPLFCPTEEENEPQDGAIDRLL